MKIFIGNINHDGNHWSRIFFSESPKIAVLYFPLIVVEWNSCFYNHIINISWRKFLKLSLICNAAIRYLRFGKFREGKFPKIQNCLPFVFNCDFIAISKIEGKFYSKNIRIQNWNTRVKKHLIGRFFSFFAKKIFIHRKSNYKFNQQNYAKFDISSLQIFPRYLIYYCKNNFPT